MNMVTITNTSCEEVYLLTQFDELLETLRQEEADYQFDEFTNNTAYELGSRIIEKAFRENKSIVVDIRKDGELLFYSRMNGTSSRNDEWVAWKNNVVRHFGHSSYYMHVSLKASNSTVEASGLDPNDYKAEGGSFPIIMKGQGVVGTMTVSGLAGNEDHAMIVDILKERFAQA